MAHSHPLKRILIVGGGPFGWLTAAFLARHLRKAGATLTLMESVKLGTSGVGEASDPSLVALGRKLGIDEAHLMHDASATYQLGTKFLNWIEDKHEFWNPYGLCSGKINDIDLFHFWLKSVQAGRPEGPYSSYSLQALLAQADKAPRPLRGPSPVMERGEYGYHVDPAALADAMREMATQAEVNHLFDDVRNVVRNDAGAIEKIETKSGRSLTADLYLDCTPDGVVIEGGLGDPWISWSNLLPCDRGVIQPMPREAELHPYTRATALPAGWLQLVPLSHRVAGTYYFSSAHLQEEAAVRELLLHATSAKASSAEPRFLKIRSGRRQSFWLHNCVALGPAAGRLEPLAAADYLLLQRGLEQLALNFPDSNLAPVLARSFNQRMAAVHDSVRDATLLPYVLTKRNTSSFWQEVKKVAVPESLQALIDLHDENGTLPPEALETLPEMYYHHLFVGAGRLPRRPLLAADALDFNQVVEIMGKMKAQNGEWLAKLPSHKEVMDKVHKPVV